MTAIGKVESFDDTNENWKTYAERVKQFFLANNIDDAHKVPTSLSYLRSAEGSSCTAEASYQVFSTDSCHSTGALEPEALGN